MKNLALILFLFTGMLSYAQDDAAVSGNTVTIRETAPVWPGCEDSSDKEECFNKKMMEHVKNNYKYPKNEQGEFVRGKVTVTIKVNEKGKVVVESVEGDHPKINAEAKRMVEKMPKMTPGRKGGKPTAIKYTFPFNF